jgi:lysophospholipase L1-like esterase
MSSRTDAESGVMVDITGRTGRGLGKILDDDGPTDLVIIMVGTNDMSTVSASGILESVKSLHAACHARGARTVALVPPVPPHGDRIRRQAVSRLLAAWGQHEPNVVALIDPEELVPRTANLKLYDPDVIHFSPAGSCALGQGLARILQGIFTDGFLRVRNA